MPTQPSRIAFLCSLLAARLYAAAPPEQPGLVTSVPAVVLKDMNGLMVKRRNVTALDLPSISSVDITIRFKREGIVLLYRRYGNRDCDACPCWEEVKRLSSRYGNEQTVTIGGSAQLVSSFFGASASPRSESVGQCSTALIEVGIPQSVGVLCLDAEQRRDLVLTPPDLEKCSPTSYGVPREYPDSWFPSIWEQVLDWLRTHVSD